MSTAAVYARKSQEDARSAEDKSVDRQVAVARDYCAEHGIVVASVHVDDGISGGEFRDRHGLTALLDAANRGKFDTVVVMSLDRLGRD
jgi:DNA invertase Pin-like site-specific DNA recombinase